MCVKKSILLALLCAFVFVGCESGDAIDYSDSRVAGRSYVEQKYGGCELHFGMKGDVKLIEHSEAGTTDITNQLYKMIADTIYTYNDKTYSDVRDKFIYHDTYLTSYYGDDYILIEIE